jgi:hypothetical protein
MLTASGCVSTRIPEIEQRIAGMPEGKEKTVAIIQYEQLRAQRASAMAAQSAAISAAMNQPVYQPPVVIQQAPQYQ